MIKVTILIGPSGSGKSTWVHNLEGPVTICSADDYFMKGGEYRFNPSKLPQAHARCMRLFIEGVRYYVNPGHVVVDNTNTTIAEVAPYLAVAQAYGAEVECIRFGRTLTIDELFERNTHGVPRNVIARHMANIRALEDDTWPRYWPALNEAKSNTDIPFTAIVPEDLGGPLEAGEHIVCPKCGEKHQVKNSVPPSLLWYRCGDRTFLAGVSGSEVTRFGAKKTEAH